MQNLQLPVALAAITKILQEMGEPLNIDAVAITADTCPNDVGLTSHLLISAMSRIENVLKLTIPVNCYIFHDKGTKRKLTIREATEKLLKLPQNVR